MNQKPTSPDLLTLDPAPQSPTPPGPLLPRIAAWLYARRWRLLGLFVGILLPLMVFGMLADEVVEQESFPFDAPMLLYLHSISTPWLDRIMLGFSLLGYGWGVFPLAFGIGLFLLWRRERGDALFWILSLGGTTALNQLAKPAFGRLRPHLWQSIAPETSYSFPSGHAMGSMAFVSALCVLLWPTRWRWPTLILGTIFVLGVGLSRIYLGVHYPSDILAGWTASLSWVLGVSFILYRHLTKPRPEAEPTEAG